MSEYKMNYRGVEITFTEEWFGTDSQKFYFSKMKDIEHFGGNCPMYKFKYDGKYMQIPCDEEQDRELYKYFFPKKASGIIPRNPNQIDNDRDLKVYLKVLSGKTELHLSMMSSTVTMRQNKDGFVYFNTLPGHEFIINDYYWEGPRYKTVTEEKHSGGIKSKDKSKRHGGLVGAAVGTVLMPGVGTAIGYAATSKKKTKGKTKDKTKVYSETKDVEDLSTARLTLTDKDTGYQMTFAFGCDSKTDMMINQFKMPNSGGTISVDYSVEETNVVSTSEQDIISLLKQYKELLDAGVISQEEFDIKKAELLKK